MLALRHDWLPAGQPLQLLPPFFRLVQSLVRGFHGCLRGLLGLLGCSLGTLGSFQSFLRLGHCSFGFGDFLVGLGQLLFGLPKNVVRAVRQAARPPKRMRLCSRRVDQDLGLLRSPFEER